MESGFTIDGLIDLLARRVATRVRAELAQDGTAAAVRPRLMTVEQAATYLGRTREAVQHLIAERRIPVVRSDRRVFLDVRDLDRWIDEAKTA